MTKEYKIEVTDSALVKEAAVDYGISRDDMAGLLGVSEKTYYNMMQKNHLDAERSDRFHFIRQILASGEEAFGSKTNLSKWLKTPQSSLDGYTPLNMMSTITGANRVLLVLGRIKHGITS
ncbi:antitoxin Xre/MbcA/ParS toxin-binding domain-containing protein [Ekhidna sp.]|uniref:antitoxin Xre/MbcA/ParS toxin-binding domain-containing protein n=1 Tax=Ekhidna sp. TaxID=2608089 RepID=UPI003CCBD56D